MRKTSAWYLVAIVGLVVSLGLLLPTPAEAQCHPVACKTCDMDAYGQVICILETVPGGWRCCEIRTRWFLGEYVTFCRAWQYCYWV